MTPIYEHDGVTIFNGDSLELMQSFRDKQFNLVLTDTPYGIDLEYDIYKDTPENWRKLILSAIPQFKRIATMSILPCCRIAELPFIYQNVAPDWLISWFKGSPGHRSFVGFNDWEPLLVYGKNEGVVMHDYFYAKPSDPVKGHPCPKSVEWASWLISRTTKEGDVVIDPFMGSGTVGVACKKLNRRFVGIDLSPAYCAIAISRFSQNSMYGEI